jgi:predicted nucleotidyltransferase
MEVQELNEIRDLLSPVFAKNSVKKVVLFGSLARGSETRKSDLDLMIVMETSKRFFDRYDAFEEVYRLMKGRSVDMLIYTPDELEGISHRKFIQSILTEGKIIYER